MDQPNSRFQILDGKTLVEVRIAEPMQLFDARDPAPFRARDLDEDFEEYIISSVKELHRQTEFEIHILIGKPSTESNLSQEIIEESIRSHFAYREDQKTLDLRTFLKRAQLYFGIGLLVLVFCISLAHWLTSLGTPSPALAIVREGIIIFGWVSLWKPIELILFDWIPLYEALCILRRIRRCKIRVVFGQSR